MHIYMPNETNSIDDAVSNGYAQKSELIKYIESVTTLRRFFRYVGGSYFALGAIAYYIKPDVASAALAVTGLATIYGSYVCNDVSCDSVPSKKDAELPETVQQSDFDKQIGRIIPLRRFFRYTGGFYAVLGAVTCYFEPNFASGAFSAAGLAMMCGSYVYNGESNNTNQKKD